MSKHYAWHHMIRIGLFGLLSLHTATAQIHTDSADASDRPSGTNAATEITKISDASYLPLNPLDTSTPFRLLIIPVYFAEDPDCDPDCPVGDYDCDNFQPIEWTPSLANVWNTYFCECSEEPCDHCMPKPCSEEPCDPQYPPADELSINEYYIENSMGQLHLTGDVTNHYELAVDVCPGNSSVVDDIAEAAVAAAQSDLINGPLPGFGWDIDLDFEGRIVSNTYDGLIILHPQVPSHNLYGWTDRTRRIIWQDSMGWRVGSHELGHLMADHIGHSGSWECTDSVWEGQCTQAGQNDYYDVMGFGHGQFKTPHKIKYGWLSEDQILTLNHGDSGIYTLTPLETPDGLKALRIPRGDDFYHFEFRQPIGEAEQQMVQTITTGFPALESWTLDGLIPYRASSASGNTLLLDLTPNSITGPGQSYVVADHLDGMLREGQTYFDSTTGFMRVLDIRNAGAAQAQIDVEVLFTTDCDENGRADVCDLDCQGLEGLCSQSGCGQASDCNGNAIPDACETDCNGNGLEDSCDIQSGISHDNNNNAIPDECELTESWGPLFASDGEVGDSFGHSVAISGTTAIIGAPLDRHFGIKSGSAYIFRYNQAGWFQQSKLTPMGGSSHDHFGTSVAIEGDTAIVGSPGDNDHGPSSGAAYVYHFDGHSWIMQSKLFRGNALDYFGRTVAISGDTLIVGADNAGDQMIGTGAVYVFHFDGTTWSPGAELVAPDGHTGDQFGASLSISGDRLFVGAPFDGDQGTESGSVYVYHHDGDSWVQQAKLTAEDGANNDHFGDSVSISENTAIIGAPSNDAHGVDSGAAYIFHYDGFTWSQQVKLVASDTLPIDRFGDSVSISGDTVLVGAVRHDAPGTDSGAAYVFRRVGTNWTLQTKLAASNGSTGGHFGNSVSISGGTAVIGAPDNTGSSSDSGAAYLFAGLNDCNGNGESDVLEWVSEPDLDCNMNRNLDVCDLSQGTSFDQIPPGGDGIPDDCQGDCNGNGILDDEDLIAGTSQDCTENGIPDECERTPDCNLNYIADHNEICESAIEDCNQNLIPDSCEPDCNGNHIPDDCDLDAGTSADCNTNQEPDECDIALGLLPDCNINGVPDECDLSIEISMDCTDNGIPDECDIAEGTENDCNTNGIPDECEIADETVADCTNNGIPDECEIDAGIEVDCDNNDIPDVCEIGSLWERLPRNDANQINGFGQDIAIDGSSVIIGAPDDSENYANSGAAYVFVNDGSGWHQQAKLTAVDPQYGDRFGTSVALAGNTLVVGAPSHQYISLSPGAAYIFQREGGAWTQRAKLTAHDGEVGDLFGSAVAIHGNTVIVGAPNDDYCGSAYVFQNIDGRGWQQMAKLIANDHWYEDAFGSALAIHENTIVVTAPSDRDHGPSSGSAYVFTYSDQIGWHQQSKLLASDGQSFDYFGKSIAMSADFIIVGAPNHDDQGIDHGAAYVFRYEEVLGWQEQIKLLAQDGERDDIFGMNVDIDQHVIAIASSGSRNNAIAHVFQYDGMNWQQSARYTHPHVHPISTALSDHRIAVGTFMDNGSAYVVPVSSLLTDCNGNGVTDRCDIAEQSAADCDGNDVLDVCELRWVDCNGNGVDDACDTDSGTSPDVLPLEGDGIPDECQADCNSNNIPDDVDILTSVSADCNANRIPDECEQDCNHNGIEDSCDIESGQSPDCNQNGIPDGCDIASGETVDMVPGDGDGIPDTCQTDCNANGLPDIQEVAEGTLRDLNQNNIADECDVQFRVPKDYPMIQDAVDAAPSGGLVAIAPGVYSGPGNQFITVEDKQLFIFSEQGPQDTVIDPLGNEQGFQLTRAGGSLIHGLTIQNGVGSLGGAICILDGSGHISNCILQNNRTTHGGAIAIISSSPLQYALIENCLIMQNVANGLGGGVYVSKGTVVMRNCTITENRANVGGGVYMAAGDHEMSNTLAWNNRAPEGPEIALMTLVSRGVIPVTLTADYSNVRGGVDDFYFGSLTGITVNWGDSNLDTDPGFVTPPQPGTARELDYHLRSDSPCIDAGDPLYVPHPGDRDIDGERRSLGDRVDIGADERMIDCNHNRQFDAIDIALGISDDCNGNGMPDECDVAQPDSRHPISQDCNDNGIPDECEFAPCNPCDINGDGKINEEDEQFLEGCLIEPDPDRCRSADLDGDGKISEPDQAILYQCMHHALK